MRRVDLFKQMTWSCWAAGTLLIQEEKKYTLQTVWSDGTVAWRKQVGKGGVQMLSLHYKHAQTVHLSKVALRSLNRTIRKSKKKKGRLFFCGFHSRAKQTCESAGISKTRTGASLVRCKWWKRLVVWDPLESWGNGEILKGSLSAFRIRRCRQLNRSPLKRLNISSPCIKTSENKQTFWWRVSYSHRPVLRNQTGHDWGRAWGRGWIQRFLSSFARL